MSSNLNIIKNEENELDELTNSSLDKYYRLLLKDRINLKNKDKNNEIPKKVIINNHKPRKEKKILLMILRIKSRKILLKVNKRRNLNIFEILKLFHDQLELLKNK